MRKEGRHKEAGDSGIAVNPLGSPVLQEVSSGTHRQQTTHCGQVPTPGDQPKSGCVMRRVLVPDHSVRLRAFLALDDVKLNVIALLQSLITVQLDR